MGLEIENTDISNKKNGLLRKIDHQNKCIEKMENRIQELEKSEAEKEVEINKYKIKKENIEDTFSSLQSEYEKSIQELEKSVTEKELTIEKLEMKNADISNEYLAFIEKMETRVQELEKYETEKKFTIKNFKLKILAFQRNEMNYSVKLKRWIPGF